MPISSLVGSIGVTMLLIAFFLNQFRYISQESYGYILLNIGGAAISALASVMIHFIPFLILEAIWVLVGVAALIKRILA